MTAALLAIIAAAFAVQAALGFGGALLALSIGSLFLPVPALLPLVVPASATISLGFVLFDRHHVRWRMLLRGILPLLAIGMVLGTLLVQKISPQGMRQLLGAVVLVASARGLAFRSREASTDARALRPLWVFVAGLVHGMIATGGPPLVYAMAGSRLDKRAFRGTLAVVWLSLNVALSIRFWSEGSLGVAEARFYAMLVPCLVVAMWIGHRVHQWLNPQHFQIAIYGLLLVAGLVLIVT